MKLRQLVHPHEPLGDRAPIVEALVDVQTSASSLPSLDALRRFRDEQADRYPSVQTLTQWANQIHVGQEGEATTTSRSAVYGFSFRDAEGRHVVQVRRDGFTVSRLAPYDTWEALRSAAHSAWGTYLALAKPDRLRRVAVRAINHLSLPGGSLELNEWFQAFPQVPSILGTASEAHLRVALQHPDWPQLTGLVTLASALPRIPGESGFVLDLDVFITGDRPLDELWSVLEELRRYKNDLFFGILTKRTLEKLKA